MAESEYFQAVIDACKLLSLKTINFPDSDNDDNSLTNSIYFQLEKIEIELEKYVPRISPLYSALNIEKHSLKSQSDYWEGVRDTTNLIRNYITHNKENFTREDYELFLQKILVKSSQKLEPKTSPLIEKLGLEINNQQGNSQKFSHKQEQAERKLFTSEENQEVTSQADSNLTLNNQVTEEQFDENLQEKKAEIYLEAESFSDDQKVSSERPKTAVTTWEFETPVQENSLENSEEMVELALEELKRDNTISNLRNGLLSQINNEITKLDSETEIKPIEEKQIPIVQLSPKNKENDLFKESETFSSSLKDALKMLRTDEENIED